MPTEKSFRAAFWHSSTGERVTVRYTFEKNDWEADNYVTDAVFEPNETLTSIAIPDGVTSIGDEAFLSCRGLTSIAWPSALAKELNRCMPRTSERIALHIADLSGVSAKFRPNAAVGFAEDDRDCTDENGKKYLKYIKANAVKLAKAATEHPALLYLMLREKLIAAKDLETVTATVQESGNAKLIAAMLDYGNSAVAKKDKAKVQQAEEG